MTDGDLSIEEKRVFSTRQGKTEVFVASSIGVVRVAVSGDLVGEFGVDHRCTARDIAGADGKIAVATDEDVLLAPGYEPTGFGPATAVGLADETLVAAGEDGTVGVRPLGDGEWTEAGQVDDVRAVDGRLLAASDGVYRIVGDEVTHAGLSDVRDVAAAGPLAATGDGLFYLANGWMVAREGAWDTVAASGGDSRAHAVSTAGVVERTNGEWAAVDLPVGGLPVSFAYGDSVTCGVTEDGDMLVDSGDGWRTQPLGLYEVGGIAIP